jgi:hypothetical protein
MGDRRVGRRGGRLGRRRGGEERRRRVRVSDSRSQKMSER